MDFAVDAHFAQAPGNQLRVLGTKVQYQDFFLVDIGMWR